jgi:hypothetical protein
MDRRRFLKLSAAAGVAAAAGAACSGDDRGVVSPPSSTAGSGPTSTTSTTRATTTTTTRLRPAAVDRTFDLNALSPDVDLPGPMQGAHRWLNDPERAQKEIPEYPYELEYERLFWTDFERERGVYDFSKIDAIRERVRSTQRVYGLALMPLLQGFDCTPGYVMDEAGIFQDSRGTVWLDWDHPTYVESWERMISALGDYVDGDPRCEFMDIGAWGHFGEAHNFPVQDQYAAAGFGEASEATRVRLHQAHIDAFPTTQLLAQSADVYSADNIVAQVPQLGFRRNSLLNEIFVREFDLASRPQGVQDRWQTRPFVVECLGFEPQDFDSAEDQLRWYHVSSIADSSHHRLWGSEMSAGEQDAWRRASRTVGYRLRAERLVVPDWVTAGGAFRAVAEWRNDGLCPLYHPWQVSLRLSAAGRAAIDLPSGLDVRAIPPGAPDPWVITDEVRVPADVPPGTYDLSIVVTDPLDARVPLRLANEGRREDGAYPVGSIEVA